MAINPQITFRCPPRIYEKFDAALREITDRQALEDRVTSGDGIQAAVALFATLPLPVRIAALERVTQPHRFEGTRAAFGLMPAQSLEEAIAAALAKLPGAEEGRQPVRQQAQKAKRRIRKGTRRKRG